MERLLEEDGSLSSLNYVENVLDTNVFHDDVRAQQFIKGDLTEDSYASRLQLGMQAARMVAAARWQNRKDIAREYGDAYGKLSPDEKRALAEPQNDQLDDIREAFAPHRHRLQYINSLEKHLEELETAGRSHLREGQSDVFGALRDFLNAPGEPVKGNAPTKAGYIKMPTGMGKTVVAVELVKALDYPKTLILTSRKDILQQTVGQNGQRGFSQFAPNTHVTTYYQDEQNLEGNVVVMTYASFNNLMAKDELPQDFCDLVICDEVHRALGEATGKNVQRFIEGKMTVGLTATDEFAENKKVSQLLPEKIYDISLRECVDKGWLAPVQAWVYKTDVEIDQDKQKDFSAVELSRLTEVEGRNQKAVEFAKEFVEKGIQGIISCIPGENVRHAEDVAALLRKTEIVDAETGEIRRIRAQELRGDMSMQDRQAIYADYEAGKIDVLTFVDLLVEGWDSTCAKFLINLRPTCSPVFSVQRFGRILRPTGEGFPAQVIEFIDDTKKAQHTVLHTLGEYRYAMGRVYGPGDWKEQGTYKQMHLSQRLTQHISQVNLQKVTQIVKGRPYEADFSELLFVDDVAAQFDVCDAALLFMAERHGMKIHMAAGDPSAQLMQIREIDRDKLAKIIHTQYAWLQGRDQDWVQEYIGRYHERQRQLQEDAFTAASVGDAALRAASAEELAEQQDRERREQQIKRDIRRGLAVQHLKTNLDKLLSEVASGGLSGADFKTIITMQTKAGTLQPLSVIHLVMGGKKEGLWGEVQESLIQAMFYRPAVASSALSMAQTMGYVKEVTHDVRPRVRQYHTYTTITTNEDTKISVEASARDQKTTRQLATVYAMADMLGIDTGNMNNPYAIGQAKEEFLLPSLDQAKHQLAQIFQKSQKDNPVYENASTTGNQVRTVVRFELDGAEIEVSGKGRNAKQASSDAAFRALIMYDEELTEMQRKVREEKEHREAQAASMKAQIDLDNLDPEASDFNPSSVIRKYCQRYQLGKPIYRHEHVDGGILHTVTIVNSDGEPQTFSGTVIAKYQQGDDKENHKNQIIASRKVACLKALKALGVIPQGTGR